MSIRASAAKEIDALIGDLTGPHAVARETAIARLTVIGPRAVERLVAVVESSNEPGARLSALRALEGIGDPRSLKPALSAAAHDADPGVAATAVGLARTFIRQDRGTDVVDRLTKIALDTARADAVRVAAVLALKDLGTDTVAPLLKTLAGDPSTAVRREATRPAGGGRRTEATQQAGGEADAVVARAADDGLPDTPEQLRAALASASRATTLASLLRIVERVREREAAEPVKRREKWAAARAAAHLALAKRRSRLGVYDLREWLESARTPLPVDAFAALSLVGDGSCLEPIATRYAASPGEWSHDQLADLFGAIVRRESLSRRHPTIKRIERKQKRALDELWPQTGAPQRRPGPRR